MENMSIALEVKELTEAGSITGYGAVFGNVDLAGDRLMPGAFTKSLRRHAAAKTMPLMLWNHNDSEVIGVWSEVNEDSKGLMVGGRLVLDVARAREVHALMKAGALGGLSIGYRTTKDAMDGNVRLLNEVDLWEVSPVAFPANTKARITDVKSNLMTDFARRLRDGTPPSVKEFEDILRDAGIPKALATGIASVGYAKAIRSESDGKASDAAMTALRAAVMAYGNRT